MKIIIHPWSRKLRNGNKNPKDYPYWKELVKELVKEHELIQVGEEGEEKLVDDFRTNLFFGDLKDLLNNSDMWISIDSFLQHLAWRIGKKGIVLFGQSNPDIFGHKENINLFVDKKYFRQWQFQTWEETDYKVDAFVSIKEVLKVIN